MAIFGPCFNYPFTSLECIQSFAHEWTPLVTSIDNIPKAYYSIYITTDRMSQELYGTMLAMPSSTIIEYIIR